jgi:hypothetical protein
MYKIMISPETQQFTGFLKGNSFIPVDPENSDYQQFIQDVVEQGIEIVEGPDIIEPSYIELRQQAYPSLQEQQDMQYWDAINGTTLWQDTITAIKEEYPKTIIGGTTVGPVPDWVQEAADNWVYNQKLNQYITALETLINFTVYDDRPEVDDEEYPEYQKSLDAINEFVNEYLNS